MLHLAALGGKEWRRRDPLRPENSHQVQIFLSCVISKTHALYKYLVLTASLFGFCIIPILQVSKPGHGVMCLGQSWDSNQPCLIPQPRTSTTTDTMSLRSSTFKAREVEG